VGTTGLTLLGAKQRPALKPLLVPKKELCIVLWCCGVLLRAERYQPCELLLVVLLRLQVLTRCL